MKTCLSDIKAIAIAEFENITGRPADDFTWFDSILMPVIDGINDVRVHGTTFIAGIAGPQGTGKSTIAQLLKLVFELQGMKCTVLSLDDLYLPWNERQQFNREQFPNPYYSVPRGNPGTHDIALGIRTLHSLCSAVPDTLTVVPRFEKALHDGKGDRLPVRQWAATTGRPDIILFEGWCLGAQPVSHSEYEGLRKSSAFLREIQSRLGDGNGTFGWQVNLALAPYQPLFGMVDMLVYLEAPSMSCVYQWRLKQERHMKQRTGAGLDDASVHHLVDTFMPITLLLQKSVRPMQISCPVGCRIQLGNHQIPQQYDFFRKFGD